MAVPARFPFLSPSLQETSGQPHLALVPVTVQASVRGVEMVWALAVVVIEVATALWFELASAWVVEIASTWAVETASASVVKLATRLVIEPAYVVVELASALVPEVETLAYVLVAERAPSYVVDLASGFVGERASA